jgi:hypothetical protein
VDDIKRCAEHDDIGIVVSQTKDPKSDDVTPLGQLAQGTRVSVATINTGFICVRVCVCVGVSGAGGAQVYMYIANNY